MTINRYEYEDIFEYIEKSKIIKIVGATGTGKSIITTLLLTLFDKPSILFSRLTTNTLQNDLKLINKPMNNSIRLISTHNRHQIYDRLQRQQGNHVTVLALDDIDPLFLRDYPETKDRFEKIIVNYTTNRNNIGSTPIVPNNVIVPNFKKLSISFNGVDYKIDAFFDSYKIYIRNKKIDYLLNQ